MKGWKTLFFGLLVAFTGMLSDEATAAFVGEHLPAVGGSIGTIIVVLRFLTNSSIFHK
jgi:hypothetical protein